MVVFQSAYALLVVISLVLILFHALVAPPRVPLWIPVLLMCIALLVGAGSIFVK